jgi:flagellar motor switch protein FliM
MGKILSQEEIDALLGSASDLQGAAVEATPAPAPTKTHSAYNFRRPDRVSKDQIRSLHFMHDRFARNVGTSLSAYLRTVTDLSIVSVEQFAYSEFLMSLPDPTAFYAVSMQPFDGLAALELSPGVAFTMIDRMLGGRGRTSPVSRALTEIEQNVVDAVVRLLLENLTELWRPIGGVEFRIQARETRPQMLQVSAPNEVIILLVFDIRIADARGMLNVALPAAVIEAVGRNFSQGWRVRKDPSECERGHLADNLARVPLRVEAVLETTMPTADVLALEAGDVIALDRGIGQPVDVQVCGASKFAARLVRLDRHAGLAIESLADTPRMLEGAA